MLQHFKLPRWHFISQNVNIKMLISKLFYAYFSQQKIPFIPAFSTHGLPSHDNHNSYVKFERSTTHGIQFRAVFYFAVTWPSRDQQNCQLMWALTLITLNARLNGTFGNHTITIWNKKISQLFAGTVSHLKILYFCYRSLRYLKMSMYTWSLGNIRWFQKLRILKVQYFFEK